MRRLIIFFIFIAISRISYSQVKIGNNPSQIRSSSILELESTDKVLVISRMSTSQINAVNNPYAGALVYNTDTNCVYMYDGSTWRSLCTPMNGITVTTAATAPTNNNEGDFWINNTRNNATSIWDGSKWVLVSNSPTRGNGAPSIITAPNPIAGDIYVDNTTGIVYAYDGTTWVQSGGNIKADNGLLVSANNTVQLGGALIKPTIITTDATNTLTIKGLQNGDTTQDDIVSINRTTGSLRKINATNLFKEEVTELIAIDGQVQFNPSIPISDVKKVNVYRNGVRIDFTVVNSTTIEIESEATCYSGDQIRIVQFY